MDPQLPFDSIWKNQNRQIWSFICPLCKSPRRLRYGPRPRGLHYFQVFFASGIVSLLFWPWTHWKGLVSFIPIWMIFETVYRWRVRGGVVCSQCGFDPILFMVNEKWAKTEIEKHWRKKFAEKGIPYPEPEITLTEKLRKS